MSFCRLGALKEAMREWNGPVTVSVYIEFPGLSPEADSCEAKVKQFVQETVENLWPGLARAPPISVSLLYASQPVPEAKCDVQLTGEQPQPQNAATQHAADTHTGAALPPPLLI